MEELEDSINDFVEALLKEIQIIGDFLKTYNKKVSSIYFWWWNSKYIDRNRFRKSFKEIT